jgi:hypothetical protein
MPEYRAYKVGIGGHFIGYDPLVCENDHKAIAAAKKLVDGHDVELWCCARIVIRLPRSLSEPALKANAIE